MLSLLAQPWWSTLLQVYGGLEKSDAPVSGEGLVSLVWLKVVSPALHQRLEETARQPALARAKSAPTAANMPVEPAVPLQLTLPLHPPTSLPVPSPVLPPSPWLTCHPLNQERVVQSLL